MTIEELLAREEIQALMAVYNTAGDSGRKEEFASVFTDGACLTATGGIDCKGKSDIIATLFTEKPQKNKTSKQSFVRHHLTTSKITVVDEVFATGRTYFQVVTNQGLDHGGVYTDEFHKLDGQWKIAKRDVQLDYTAPSSQFV